MICKFLDIGKTCKFSRYRKSQIRMPARQGRKKRNRKKQDKRKGKKRKFGRYESFVPKRDISYDTPTALRTKRGGRALGYRKTYYQVNTRELDGQPNTFGYWCASRNKCLLVSTTGTYAKETWAMMHTFTKLWSWTQTTNLICQSSSESNFWKASHLAK